MLRGRVFLQLCLVGVSGWLPVPLPLDVFFFCFEVITSQKKGGYRTGVVFFVITYRGCAGDNAFSYKTNRGKKECSRTESSFLSF
jgi:hypothetical protein